MLTPGWSQGSEDSRTLSPYLWIKPGPEISPELLAGRARSWSLAIGLRDPRAETVYFRLDLFREKHTPQSLGHLRRQEQPWGQHTPQTKSVGCGKGRVGSQNVVWLACRGWVISQANEQEDYSNCFGEGVAISGNWGTVHFFGL